MNTVPRKLSRAGRRVRGRSGITTPIWLRTGKRRLIRCLFLYVSPLVPVSAFKMFISGFQAGLFSAVTTAFIIDSYKWLQPDPTEVSIQLLSRITEQLGGSSNQTAPQIRGPTDFRPSVWDVAVNTLWFSSLVCSLIAALLCILAKQWIREYARSIPISLREDISLRQFRYDGLKNWGVKGVIVFLPILLEAALALFLVGLVVLLWKLHIIMAAVVSVLVAAALFFYLVTLTLPAFSAIDCAFRTPTSWNLRRLGKWRMWRRTGYYSDPHRSWQDLDMDAASKSHKPTAGLLWLAKVSQNRRVFSAAANCVISDSGADLFTDLEFLEGVMAHIAGCSIEVLQDTVKGLTSLTTLIDRDLKDQAIRDFRRQVSPHRLAWLRRVALKRLMRIWNTTVPIMKAPLLDYMLTMLLIFNKSDVGGEDVGAVERNSVETIAFLSSFIRALFDEAEKSAQDRIAYGWLPTQGQHIHGDQQVLCAKADNLLRHEIRSKLSSQEALQGPFVLFLPSAGYSIIAHSHSSPRICRSVRIYPDEHYVRRLVHIRLPLPCPEQRSELRGSCSSGAFFPSRRGHVALRRGVPQNPWCARRWRFRSNDALGHHTTTRNPGCTVQGRGNRVAVEQAHGGVAESQTYGPLPR